MHLSNCSWCHLVNAGKYAFSAAAVIMTAIMKIQHFNHPDSSLNYSESWHPAILVILAIRTLYTILWDLLMDWALFRKNPSAPFLRPVTLFSSVRYYFAMVTNTLARCLWIFTLQSSWCYAGCSFIFSFIETFRRGQWMVFRMEHQFLKSAHLLEEHEELHGEDHMEGVGGWVAGSVLASLVVPIVLGGAEILPPPHAGFTSGILQVRARLPGG